MKLDECRTGGGFDIWAAAKVKKEYEHFIKEKEELEYEIANKKYYILDKEQNNMNYGLDLLNPGFENASNGASMATDRNLKYKVLKE